MKAYKGTKKYIYIFIDAETRERASEIKERQWDKGRDKETMSGRTMRKSEV